jgi:predicted transcriptional regulator
MLSKTNILNAISNRKSFDIFKTIASAHSNSDTLITHLKLTRKQYYSRMSLLINAGLVKKEKGRYLLTALGRVIYNAHLNLQATFDRALENYWKLKAIDSMQSSEERDNVISVLIDDQEIKHVLLNEEPHKHIEPVNKIVSGPVNQALTVKVS